MVEPHDRAPDADNVEGGSGQPGGRATCGGDFGLLLKAVGRVPASTVVMPYRPTGGEFVRGAVTTVADVSTAIEWPQGRDQWWSVQPLVHPGSGRGKVEHVVGLACLYADLDAVPGKLIDYATCWRVVVALERLFDRPAAAVVDSGHGLQPYWSVSGPGSCWSLEDDVARDRARGALKRFGVLVESVAKAVMGMSRRDFDDSVGFIREKEQGATWVDSNVYDLARVLRVPGTVNHKDDPVPVELVRVQPLSAPLTIDDMLSMADEHVPAPATPPRGQVSGEAARQRAERDLDAFTQGLRARGLEPTSRSSQDYQDGIEWRVRCPGHGLDGDDHADDSLSFGISTVRDEPRFVWYCHAGCRQEHVASAVGLSFVGGAAPEWTDPEPLVMAPVPVDLSACPSAFRDMVLATAASVEAPVGVPLVFALGVLSAATRGCFSVRISPSWDAGPLAIYALALTASGERKSPAAAPILAPLEKAEAENAEEIAARNRERAVQLRQAQSDLKEAEKSSDDRAAVDALSRIERLTPLPVPRLVLSDATTEALGVHMSAQRGPAALITTEGTAYATVAGAYSDSGANVGLLNNAYDGEAYVDLRVRRTGMDIPHPFLAIAAAVQPEVMIGYANRQTEGSGFLGRHLFQVPESMVGTRTYDGPPIPTEVRAAWSRVLGDLAEGAWQHHLARISGEPVEYVRELVLAEEARVLLIRYAQDLEARKTPGSPVHELGGWAEKHPARIARIAALFALLDSPSTDTVQEGHMQAALSIADALIDHAIAAFRILRNVRSVGPIQHVLTALKGRARVTTRDVHRLVGGQTSWCHGADDVRRVLNDLAEMRYVRQVHTQAGSKGGRPAEVWDVHPTLAG